MSNIPIYFYPEETAKWKLLIHLRSTQNHMLNIIKSSLLHSMFMRMPASVRYWLLCLSCFHLIVALLGSMQLKVFKEQMPVQPWKIFALYLFINLFIYGSMYWSLNSRGIEREGLDWKRMLVAPCLFAVSAMTKLCNWYYHTLPNRSENVSSPHHCSMVDQEALLVYPQMNSLHHLNSLLAVLTKIPPN